MSDTYSDNESMDETLSEIRDASANATNDVKLPEKSRKLYDRVYQDFMKWRISKDYQSFEEDVILAYFLELSKKFKSTTLWTCFSMLKSTLTLNHEVDISKYYKLMALLKSKAAGSTVKKSKTFSAEEINTFLKEAHDRDYLAAKIALIFGIVGGCRRHELYKLEFKDVQIFGPTILVRIRNTTTKSHRVFTISGSYYDLCKKYIALRPECCCNPSFFLHYKAGKCFPQKVGINSFGNLGKVIASFLELPNPELYTGQCFRRTSANITFGADGDIFTTKEHNVRWKSLCLPQSGTTNSMESDIQISSLIQDAHENIGSEILNGTISTGHSYNLSESNAEVTDQHQNSFDDESIKCVNINIPCSTLTEAYVDDSMESKDNVWSQINNSLESRSNDVIDLNTPSSFVSEGYTSDSIEHHPVKTSVSNEHNETKNGNTPSKNILNNFIEECIENKDQFKNKIQNSLDNTGDKTDKVVNINIPSTSNNLLQSLSALVRFNNCHIQNVNINYTK